MKRSCSFIVRFQRRLSPQEYALAVLACQHALALAGFGTTATVRPDGTADDEQINKVFDELLATSPWSV